MSDDDKTTERSFHLPRSSPMDELLHHLIESSPVEDKRHGKVAMVQIIFTLGVAPEAGILHRGPVLGIYTLTMETEAGPAHPNLNPGERLLVHRHFQPAAVQSVVMGEPLSNLITPN